MLSLCHRSYLTLQIASITAKREQLEWLRPYGLKASSIAHFGCSGGHETIALMWEFGAVEAVGIDIDEFIVHQAENDLTEIRKAIQGTDEYVRYWSSAIEQADLKWWSDQVPDFFKNVLTSKQCQLEFVIQDITRPVPLRTNHYDLAFADYVLHHIWLDKERANARNDTQFAVSEMARVIETGGFAAAYERTRLPQEPSLDFEPLFLEAGLQIVHVQATRLDSGEITEYLFRKAA